MYIKLPEQKKWKVVTPTLQNRQLFKSYNCGRSSLRKDRDDTDNININNFLSRTSHCYLPKLTTLALIRP